MTDTDAPGAMYKGLGYAAAQAEAEIAALKAELSDRTGERDRYLQSAEQQTAWGHEWERQYHAALRDVGIPCELFCPKCGYQHVDAPEPESGWTNPPHRTHKCHACGHLWKPYPVATFGVLSDARFRPLGDNHHNALACPYCNPKRIDPEALATENAVLRAREEDLRVALRDVLGFARTARYSGAVDAAVRRATRVADELLANVAIAGGIAVQEANRVTCVACDGTGAMWWGGPSGRSGAACRDCYGLGYRLRGTAAQESAGAPPSDISPEPKP